LEKKIKTIKIGRRFGVRIPPGLQFTSQFGINGAAEIQLALKLSTQSAFFAQYDWHFKLKIYCE